MSARAVVLVEGESDRLAVLAVAHRQHRDLLAERIEVVAMHGITNTRSFARRYGPQGLALPLAGLYDAPEEHKLRIGLAQAGIAAARTEPLAQLGFFRCDRDLEDELIRALRADAVEAVVEAAGELPSLRRLAQMPVQRDWPRERVLHRFLGVRSGRKARYAPLLVAALASGAEPPPLRALLAHLAAPAAGGDG
ncbi:TOPRIM nucleotidyl transferase/hydrolase domain-containing protein [Agrococcus carbonis]|uniref:OLD protein-like TOPRIM domain-containing protein n=1 Tax=Agrococcus carbonis TaxID=684552 RepID=A0A1H1SSM4_9MICO|nr:TOPRIM nucleotidyl transferase/hydrolase domain-containing protein [Agrococcus carbonis]SDS50858.1 hypothetical protein SAMN04489719_2483 [Agrococcus carbonis]